MTDFLLSTTPFPFSLQLLGPFAVEIASQPMGRLRTRKGQWILALLALRSETPVERGWLAGLLWPDSSEEKALYSLRRSLADLRQALGNEAWRIEALTPRTLCLNLAGAQADIRLFDQAVKQADPAAWQQAVAVYKGPLLEGCSEEWVYQERDWREEAYLQMLERLAAEVMRAGDVAKATEWLRQTISIAPFRETAQRALLRALAAQQDFAGVMMAYRDLRLRLHNELNSAPDPETTALLQQLRRAARQRGQQRQTEAAPPVVLRSVPQASVQVEESKYPPVETTTPPTPCHLPPSRTSFVGPPALLAGLCQSLAVHRLVTLTGTGGVGKTRLAIQAARESANLHTGGIWLVDLAPLQDPASIWRAVAQALEVPLASGQSAQQAVTAFLNGSPTASRQVALIILDNCEHLLDVCAQVVEILLGACLHLHILTTSRQALGVPGELQIRVPSLVTPPLTQSALSAIDLAELPDRYPALKLFVDRAQSSNPAFALTDENASDVAHICSLLDGIPLAIELAAARIRAMPPQTLAARLNNRFQLLVSENRTGLPRHRTLRALIAWSVDLLSSQEQVVLRRLAVFRGGWTLQAAEAVCAGEAAESVGSDEVLDILTSLIDKSLVFYDSTQGEERYWLQETLRQYAWQMLQETDSARAIQERQFRCYLALVHEADAGLAGANQEFWLHVLERENHNLEAALLWATEENPNPLDAIEMAGMLARFWLMRGYWKEGRTWLERLLCVPPTEATTEVWPLWARAYNGIGALAWAQGDPLFARQRYEQGLYAWQQAGNLRGQAAVLGNLGILAQEQKQFSEARCLEEQSLALRRRTEDNVGIANSLSNLGMIASQQGDYTQAFVCYAESLALRRERKDQHGIATCLNNMGWVACERGDFARADMLFAESETIFRALEDRKALAETLHSRADVADRQCKDTTAWSLVEQSIALFRALGERHGLRSSLVLLARLAQRQPNERVMLAAYHEGVVLCMEMEDRQGISDILKQMAEGFAANLRPELAVRLFAAMASWRPAQRALPDTSEQSNAIDTDVLEHWKVKLIAHLGEQAFTTAWMQGKQLTPEQALALTQAACVYTEWGSSQEETSKGEKYDTR